MRPVDVPTSMTGSLDDVFRALSGRERRRILLALRAHNLRPDRALRYPDDLARDGGSEADTERLLRLRHNHLPMLEDAGLIEWQREDQRITTGPRFDEIRPLLALIEEELELAGP